MAQSTSPFIKANICSLNPESLQGFDMMNYPSKFTEIPNKALPDIFQKGYELIFKRLGLPYSDDLRSHPGHSLTLAKPLHPCLHSLA
jgi:hypothetical protein